MDILNTFPIYFDNAGNESGDINDLSVEKPFDLEGLKNYFIYGYNTFNQTVFEGIKIKKAPKFSEKYLKTETTRDEVIELIRSKIQEFELKNKDVSSFVLPLTSGHDSRFLASLVSDKEKIKAYTYPVTWMEEDCFEVGGAKFCAEKLGMKWKKILNRQINITDHFNLYGPTIPIHSDFAFWKGVIEDLKGEKSILISGSWGDWWAGDKIKTASINNHEDFKKVFFNHNIFIPEEALNFKAGDDYGRQYFEDNKYELQDERLKKIVIAQNRSSLVRHVVATPKSMGVDSFVPFHDEEIIGSMLSLNKKESHDRQWQKDYFSKIKLTPDNNQKRLNKNIKINLRSLYCGEFEPLDAALLSKFLKREFVEEINKNILKFKKDKITPALFAAHYYLGGNNYFAKKLNKVASKKTDSIQRFYNYWSMIKPIEMVLKK